MAMVDVDDSSYLSGGLAAQVGWLGLRVGGHPALSLLSLNSRNDYDHGDNTINIITVIIIRQHHTYYVRRCGLLLPSE